MTWVRMTDGSNDSERSAHPHARTQTHLLHAEQVAPLEVRLSVDLPELRPHLLDEGSEILLKL